MFIPVTPDGVVSLVGFGHAFNFLLSEFFDLFCDVHSGNYAGMGVHAQLARVQLDRA